MSAEDCFFKFDSTGKMEKCKEPEIFRKVQVAKKALNLQIKMWVEGYDECLMGVHEYMEVFDDPPEWVEEAFRNQLRKYHREKYGSEGQEKG